VAINSLLCCLVIGRQVCLANPYYLTLCTFFWEFYHWKATNLDSTSFADCY